jgi:hypothetical protein
LLADFNFIQAKQQVIGKVQNELGVLSFIRILDQVIPKAKSDLFKFFIGLVNNIHFNSLELTSVVPIALFPGGGGF